MGGKHAARPRKGARSSGELLYADDALGEHYARCVATLGSGRFTLQLRCGSEVTAKIKGSLYKRVWVNKGDLVLAVERRLDADAAKPDFVTSKFDIVHKYTPDEERLLVRYGELAWATTGNAHGDDEEEIFFCDDDIERL